MTPAGYEMMTGQQRYPLKHLNVGLLRHRNGYPREVIDEMQR